jgi:hypothetical protein
MSGFVDFTLESSSEKELLIWKLKFFTWADI